MEGLHAQRLQLWRKTKTYKNLAKMLKLFLLAYAITLLAVANAGIITNANILAPTLKVVHNAPSAISHQSFTRILNKPQLELLITPDVQSYAPVAASATQPYATHAIPIANALTAEYAALPPFEAAAKHGSHTSVVNTLTHTPAHLTYAASPVVYKTLPLIKPVRSISYDEVRPYPRTYGHYE